MDTYTDGQQQASEPSDSEANEANMQPSKTQEELDLDSLTGIPSHDDDDGQKEGERQPVKQLDTVKKAETQQEVDEVVAKFEQLDEKDNSVTWEKARLLLMMFMMKVWLVPNSKYKYKSWQHWCNKVLKFRIKYQQVQNYINGLKLMLELIAWLIAGGHPVFEENQVSLQFMRELFFFQYDDEGKPCIEAVGNAYLEAYTASSKEGRFPSASDIRKLVNARKKLEAEEKAKSAAKQQSDEVPNQEPAPTANKEPAASSEGTLLVGGSELTSLPASDIHEKPLDKEGIDNSSENSFRGMSRKMLSEHASKYIATNLRGDKNAMKLSKQIMKHYGDNQTKNESMIKGLKVMLKVYEDYCKWESDNNIQE